MENNTSRTYGPGFSAPQTERSRQMDFFGSQMAPKLNLYSISKAATNDVGRASRNLASSARRTPQIQEQDGTTAVQTNQSLTTVTTQDQTKVQVKMITLKVKAASLRSSSKSKAGQQTSSPQTATAKSSRARKSSKGSVKAGSAKSKKSRQSGAGKTTKSMQSTIRSKRAEKENHQTSAKQPSEKSQQSLKPAGSATAEAQRCSQPTDAGQVQSCNIVSSTVSDANTLNGYNTGNTFQNRQSSSSTQGRRTTGDGMGPKYQSQQNMQTADNYAESRTENPEPSTYNSLKDTRRSDMPTFGAEGQISNSIQAFPQQTTKLTSINQISHADCKQLSIVENKHEMTFNNGLLVASSNSNGDSRRVQASCTMQSGSGFVGVANDSNLGQRISQMQSSLASSGEFDVKRARFTNQCLQAEVGDKLLSYEDKVSQMQYPGHRESHARNSSVPSNNQDETPKVDGGAFPILNNQEAETPTLASRMQNTKRTSQIMIGPSHEPSTTMEVSLPPENLSGGSLRRIEAASTNIGQYTARNPNLVFATSVVQYEEHKQSQYQHSHSRSKERSISTSKTFITKSPTNIIEKLKAVSLKATRPVSKSRPQTAGRPRTGALPSARSFTNFNASATIPLSPTPGSKSPMASRMSSTQKSPSAVRIQNGQNIPYSHNMSPKPKRGISLRRNGSAAKASGKKAAATTLNSARSFSALRAVSRLAPNPNGLSIFKGGGISARPTPVSKKFAPAYASPHSLMGNALGHALSQKTLEAKRIIDKDLTPQREALVKDLDKVVDSQLKMVVQKINEKRELEKVNRELKYKLLKRQDEVNSLEWQNRHVNAQLEEQEITVRTNILTQIKDLKEQLQELQKAKAVDDSVQKQQLEQCRVERMEMVEYVHDRKQSNMNALEQQKDSLENDKESIYQMERQLLGIKKTQKQLQTKAEKIAKGQLKQLKQTQTKQTIMLELHEAEYIQTDETSHALTTILQKKAGNIPRRQHRKQNQNFMHTFEFNQMLQENQVEFHNGNARQNPDISENIAHSEHQDDSEPQYEDIQFDNCM